MEDKHYVELAKIRFQRSKELVLEAEVLLEKGMFKSANNRAYYAIEKALSALLIYNSDPRAVTGAGIFTLVFK